MKVTRLKKKSKLHKIANRIAELHGQKAKIGYFTDSGQHETANMSYGSLAFLHAFPENGYHHTRNWLDHTKPFKHDTQASKFFKELLHSYIKKGSRVTVEKVLDKIGTKWMQKGKEVFGNTALMQGPNALLDTQELRDNLGFKTTINYTLRKV